MLRGIIQENERGLLFRRGLFVKMLKPGPFTFLGSGYEVEIVEMEATFSPKKDLLDKYLSDPNLKKELQVFTIQDSQRGLLFRDGVYQHMLDPGVHVFLGHKFSVDIVNLDEEFAPPHGHIESFIEDSDLIVELNVFGIADNERGLLFHNEQFVKMLAPGQHVYFGRRFTVTICPMEAAFECKQGALETFQQDAALAALLKVYVINENQRGLLYKDGLFVKMLEPGRYVFLGEKHDVIYVPMETAFCPEIPAFQKEGAEEDNEQNQETHYGIFLSDPNLARILHVCHIKEDERGLLFAYDIFQKMLPPGVHAYLGKSYRIEIVSTHDVFPPKQYNLEIFLKDSTMSEALSVLEVPDGSIALHYQEYAPDASNQNRRFIQGLPNGRYAFWKGAGISANTFTIISVQEPLVSADVPLYVFSTMRNDLFQRFEVKDFEKGQLYYNGKFIRLLDGGAYYFWNNGVRVEVICVDTRLQHLTLQGQELLTLDKVNIRIQCVCRYKISDYERIGREIRDYQEQIHVLFQLALRDYVGATRLDDLLENKEQLAACLLRYLKEKEAECFVTFLDAGVKDIILPGAIRDLMQVVIKAEKQAQANVITRREEVASTRSLLNTAKLLDENQTLMRLKEMEYQERMRLQLFECGEKVAAALGNNVGEINIQGGDLFERIGQLLREKKS